jgi:hypothetical protein
MREIGLTVLAVAVAAGLATMLNGWGNHRMNFTYGWTVAIWCMVPLVVLTGIVLDILRWRKRFRREHEKPLELKRSQEYGLQGRMLDINATEVIGRMMAIARVEIRNLGQPTIVDGYVMEIEYAPRKFTGEAFIPDGNMMVPIKGRPLLLTRSDCLSQKTATAPLAIGGKVVGYHGAWFDGLGCKDLPGCVVTLRFKDVAGNEYTAQDKVGAGNPTALNTYIPGMANAVTKAGPLSPRFPKHGRKRRRP